MSDEIKEILFSFILTPKDSHIQIDFDLEKKIFFLSIPLFVARQTLPRSVKKYIEARKGISFKPHSTTFYLEGDKRVGLVQEIPFRWGFDSGGRREIVDFFQLAKRCHRMLYEIALEEIYREAFQLDADLKA